MKQKSKSGIYLEIQGNSVMVKEESEQLLENQYSSFTYLQK